MLAGRSASELSYDQYYTSDPKTLVLSCLGAMGNGKSSLLNAICDEQIYRTGKGAEVSISG
jgi:predicted GTPase